MKKFSLFLIVVFLVSVSSSFQQVTAQEKTKEEQEKEKKIQQEIEMQKKAIFDQQKSLTEAEKRMKAMHFDMQDSLKNLKVVIENANKEMGRNMFVPRVDRAFRSGESYGLSGQDMGAFYLHALGEDSERTTWDFSKTIKDNTFSKEYSLDVDKTTKSVVMSVMGDCKSGEIRIKIILPNGKNYSDILIDESGNLNWRKSFTISETENKDKTGDWKFQISSTKATGFFKISLQTF